MRAVQTVSGPAVIGLFLNVKMDLHREDEQRLQSDEVAEGKRKLFWECYSDDVFAVSSEMFHDDGLN